MTDQFAALLVVLLDRLGGTTEVTQDELAAARQQLADHEADLVAYPADRLTAPDLLRIELRRRRTPRQRRAEAVRMMTPEPRPKIRVETAGGGPGRVYVNGALIPGTPRVEVVRDANVQEWKPLGRHPLTLKPPGPLIVRLTYRGADIELDITDPRRATAADRPDAAVYNARLDQLATYPGLDPAKLAKMKLPTTRGDDD